MIEGTRNAQIDCQEPGFNEVSSEGDRTTVFRHLITNDTKTPNRNAGHRGHRQRQPRRDQSIPQRDRLENRPPGWDTRLRAEAVP